MEERPVNFVAENCDGASVRGGEGYEGCEEGGGEDGAGGIRGIAGRG